MLYLHLCKIRDKVAILQRENRQLQAELQSVSYRLALKNRYTNHGSIDLPTFPRSEVAPENFPAPHNA